MSYIIVDLEATCCDRGTLPRGESEIIEIGAAALAGDGPEIIDQFDAFVRPVRHPQLTSFCTDLTSITQQMVDAADTFAVVMRQFALWLDAFEAVIFCSWGAYDKRQLTHDCTYHGVSYPFTDQHINIKKRFAKNVGLRKPCGLGQALEHVGLSFQGRPHRGIDDVKNMARLSRWIYG